jgi:hypothetical protein
MPSSRSRSGAKRPSPGKGGDENLAALRGARKAYSKQLERGWEVMRRARACCAILAGAWGIGGGVAATNATEASMDHIVTIENMQFGPQKLTVRVGLRQAIRGRSLRRESAPVATDAPFTRR